MEEIFISKSEKETKKFGEDFAKKILKRRKKTILALIGDLGGGKTTFLKGLAKGLKIKEEIVSPSFVLMRKYSIFNSPFFKTFYHLDCYRLEGKEKSFISFFKKILNEKRTILAIEWADKIEKILPKGIFFIKFEILGKKKRRISFSFK